MTIIVDVLKELMAMFIADARLSLSLLFLVGAVAAIVRALHAGPLLAGSVLLIGVLMILLDAVSREARLRSRR
jgi:hypothetical protein